MESLWFEFAKRCFEDYGTYVDEEERFFICPECGEPIYECDWTDSDFYISAIGAFCCPICEETLVYAK